MSDFPRGLKGVTVWLLLGLGLFLGVQLWLAKERTSRVEITEAQIVLKRAPDGHFHWPGTVNGKAVDFLIDTGATRTAVPDAMVRGLATEGEVQSSTAGGLTSGRVVRVELRLEGGVSASRLPVVALPELQVPLLGMDVLSRLKFTQSDGVLRLERPR